MDFLPEPGQARAEQAAGLLHGVLADQQHLPEDPGHLRILDARQGLQKLARASQAEAAEGHLQAFRGVVAGALGAIGLAQDGQRQRRAALQLVGDLAQRATAVAQRGVQAGIVAGGDRQGLPVELFEPGGEAVCHGCRARCRRGGELAFRVFGL